MFSEEIEIIKTRMNMLVEVDRTLLLWGLEGRPMFHMDLELSLCQRSPYDKETIMDILN